MRSKNSAPITRAESAHMHAVKELSCGVCGQAGPSEAHHIEQGKHFLTIPLCPDCHTGSFTGIHGQRRAWQKKTEMSVLNETIGRLK